MKSILNLLSKFSTILGVILMIIPIGFFILSPILFTEEIRADNSSKRESYIITSDLKSFEVENISAFNLDRVRYNDRVTIPTDKAISFGNKLRITSIGIDTSIYESMDPDKGLDAGVWRANNVGTPDEEGIPTVLAAHRWGDPRFGWDYRAKNLFLNLPEIRINDKIEILWEDQRFEFVVTATDIQDRTDTGADLVLYTCVDYNSDDRFFVYAKRL